jgi:pilus assembly protein CpaF
MWSGESAWRRRREGVEHTEASELAGPAYYAVVAEQVRLLGDMVQEFLDSHVEMEEHERDHAIRESIVRPVVQEYNRKAEMSGDPLLSDGAVRDIFSRLRRSHGVLAGLFEDPGVTDIHINGPGKMVWVKRNGRLEPLDLPLTKAEIDGYIEKWQAGAGHTLTPLNWGVDIRQQNARISAVHERVALDGPAVSIRLRSPAPLEGADLVERGMMLAVVWRCLEALFVHGRVNLVIGGPMGSGKTTLMQALLRALGETCRIVTIEGPRELELGPHALQLETHLPQAGDAERKGEVTARELVQRSLRMGVERMVVGECRGPEALDMLDAMSSGHDGSITTVHAGTPVEILDRLVRLCMRAPERIPLEAIRGTMKDALSLLVVVRPTALGLRVTAVSELIDLVGDTFAVQDILVWEDSRLCFTGYDVSETLHRRLREAGHEMPSLALLPRSARKGTGHDSY